MIFRPFNDNAPNVDALLALLRAVTLPEQHTGQLVLRLHFQDGRLGVGTFEIHNLRLGAAR